MKITETNIPDIDVSNIDKSKINLAEKIMYNINPLFDDLHQSRTKDYKEKLSEFKKIRNNVLSNKTEIETLFDHFKRKQT